MFIGINNKINSKKQFAALILAVLIFSLSFTAIALPFTNSILYDSNGNRVEDSSLYYEYNNFNQLVRVRNGTANGTIIEEYVYDHEGNRVIKREPLRSQTTYYVDRNFVRVVNLSGTFDTVYVYDEKDLVARRDPDGKKFFYHPDHLGSTTLVTNETGHLVEETTYEPYGLILAGGSDRYDYTGKELDIGTGLEYYGARYYDPTYAQFAQPDSVIPDAYDPQQLNRYAYVRDNPYKYTDPDGNVLTIAVAIISGAVFGGAYSLGYQTASGGQIDWVDAGKSAGIGSVAGLVGSLTMGGSFLATAAGGAAAGQAARATGNILEGEDVTEGLGNPADIALDAATAGMTNKAGGALNAVRGGSTMTPKQIGSFGERSLASQVGGQSQKYFSTPSGARIIDQFSKNIGYEAKTGYTPLTSSIRLQISKDSQLLSSSQLKGIEWWFYKSPITGKGGPSTPLANALNKAGITIKKIFGGK